jgi:hypothetical protein
MVVFLFFGDARSVKIKFNFSAGKRFISTNQRKTFSKENVKNSAREKNNSIQFNSIQSFMYFNSKQIVYMSQTQNRNRKFKIKI